MVTKSRRRSGECGLGALGLFILWVLPQFMAIPAAVACAIVAWHHERFGRLAPVVAMAMTALGVAMLTGWSSSDPERWTMVGLPALCAGLTAVGLQASGKQDKPLLAFVCGYLLSIAATYAWLFWML